MLIALLTFILFADTGSTVHFKAAQVMGQVKATYLGEASGIAVSRKQANVIWVHNDSGAAADIHAISNKGEQLRSFHLSGADATDWEDIAIGPGPKVGVDYLYIADTGNNRAHTGQPRNSVQIYRVAEPKVEKGTSPVTLDEVARYDFVYPDDAHDVEAMMIDPLDHAIYLMTKRDPMARVYRLRLEGAVGQQKAEFLGELPMTLLVAADINAEGTAILIKNYNQVWFWTRESGSTIFETLKKPGQLVTAYKIEPQGESMAFDAKGTGFYTLSEAEGRNTPLYYYELAK